MGRNIRRKDFWDQLVGQVLAMIGKWLPWIQSTNHNYKAAPPKRSQTSLNPKLVPILLRVSEDDNFDLPLTKVHEVGEKGEILFQIFVFFLARLSRPLASNRNACATILDPVVRRPISANPGQGLNFNPGFFFFCSKGYSRIFVSVRFKATNH